MKTAILDVNYSLSHLRTVVLRLDGTLIPVELGDLRTLSNALAHRRTYAFYYLPKFFDVRHVPGEGVYLDEDLYSCEDMDCISRALGDLADEHRAVTASHKAPPRSAYDKWRSGSGGWMGDT